MTADEPDLLKIDRGSVTAPAGCGKTQLIANALVRNAEAKPILVLTHTNAGVVALRSRLDRASVPHGSYRLATIDGWAMRLISTFPNRSAHDPDLLKLGKPAIDYPNIRAAAARLIHAGHINDILKASYSRLIVDEYQDCSVRQHAVVGCVSDVLPTCVLGDPMQAIFGFGADPLARWNEDVCAWFPVTAELSTPWRWINAGAEPLGRWLLSVRGQLLRGEEIDLRLAPPAVKWVELDGTEDHQRRLAAARTLAPDVDACVLIIGDATSPDSQRQFASQTPGAVTVEAVDLKDLVAFARALNLDSANVVEQVAEFAQTIMTNVGAPDLMRRLKSLRDGTARNPPTDVETAAMALLEAPSHRAAADLLSEISRQGGVRTHRPAILRACIKGLQMCDGTEGLTFQDAAIRMREQNRLLGRPLPKRAVGSTLLLKGLEAEVVVVLKADDLDARNLYVAMTRGSKMLVLCSKAPILRPN